MTNRRTGRFTSWTSWRPGHSGPGKRRRGQVKQTPVPSLSNILHYYDTLRAAAILDPVYTHRIAGCALLGLPKKTAAKKRAAKKHDASWTGKPEDVKETPFSGPPARPTKRGRVRQNAFDKEPTPTECFEEFFTPEMMKTTYDNSWAYVTHIGVIKRPTYQLRAKLGGGGVGGGGATKWFSAGWNVAK
ncbi:hypothetical protein NFJ02_20g44400 [Pycnococcus provasolii]